MKKHEFKPGKYGLLAAGIILIGSSYFAFTAASGDEMKMVEALVGFTVAVTIIGFCIRRFIGAAVTFFGLLLLALTNPDVKFTEKICFVCAVSFLIAGIAGIIAWIVWCFLGKQKPKREPKPEWDRPWEISPKRPLYKYRSDYQELKFEVTTPWEMNSVPEGTLLSLESELYGEAYLRFHDSDLYGYRLSLEHMSDAEKQVIRNSKAIFFVNMDSDKKMVIRCFKD